MNKQMLKDERNKVLVFEAKEIEKEELDTESDWKDFIFQKVKTDRFKEIFSGWDLKEKYYVVIVQI